MILVGFVVIIQWRYGRISSEDDYRRMMMRLWDVLKENGGD